MIVQAEQKITLTCPCCDGSILESLEWFKQSRFSCPVCAKDLTAEQFSVVISDLELAIDADIDEMVQEQPHTSCCGKSSSCCGSKS